MLTDSDKLSRLEQSWRAGYRPPPRLTVPDWADEYRYLARESGSTSGRWRTTTVEVARGPMLAVTEPGVHVISLMCCTQLLKTETELNIMGYFAHNDPCPILMIQPKDAAADQFSKERITPMVKVTPVLRELIGTAKTRNSDETLQYKAFPGGFLALVGAGSPDNLARRPVRVVLADEVDKYPVTREGDPIGLAEERTATFGANWLSVRACSPTVEGESRIAAAYEASDQRRASVECPHCGHRLFLNFFDHVQWSKDENGQHRPETAQIYCDACGAAWSEGERLRALTTVRWHQTKPVTCCDQRIVPLDAYAAAWKSDQSDPVDAVWYWSESARHAVYRVRCPICGGLPVSNEHAGFQASKLFSPWRKDRPADQATKWLAAQSDQDALQVWWNTQMGLPYRPHAGKEIRLEALAARGELWQAEVPEGVGTVTIGIDVQDYRIEAEVVGWGRNEESWSIDYHVIEGEFDDPNTQAVLDAYLRRPWTRADGRQFTALAACIDSGGHHTQAVYAFCKARIGRRIWAIKGESARTGERNPVWPTKMPRSRTKKTYRPVILGVNAAKDTIRHRLHSEVPGPGYMHFPASRDLAYYAQLTAERSEVKEVSGKRWRVWVPIPGRANEALDCRVYAYGALCGLMHAGLRLNERTDSLEAAPASIFPPARPVPAALAARVAPSTAPASTSVTGESRARRIASKLA